MKHLDSPSLSDSNFKLPTWTQLPLCGFFQKTQLPLCAPTQLEHNSHCAASQCAKASPPQAQPEHIDLAETKKGKKGRGKGEKYMHDSFHQNNNNNFNIIENELMHSIYIMNLWMKLILNFAAYSEWRAVTSARLRDWVPDSADSVPQKI